MPPQITEPCCEAIETQREEIAEMDAIMELRG